MSVQYVSTRSPGGEPVGFEQALLSGLAPDGGLYVPLAIPTLPHGWRNAASFTELAGTVLRTWLGESEGASDALIEEAFDFPVPLEQLDDGRTLVTISEEGWRETPKGLKASYGNCEGWTGMFFAMKVWLEYGISNIRKGTYK